MSDSDSIPQAVPEPPAPPEPQGFPWIRVLAGAMLVAVAVAAIVWSRRPDDLQLSARFEPASPAAGEKAKLFLKVGPGPVLAGAVLQKVRAEVEAPADLVFDRSSEFLLPREEEMVLGFTVDKRAAPGPRRLVVLVAAELPAGERRSVAQAVGLRRELEVVVR